MPGPINPTDASVTPSARALALQNRPYGSASLRPNWPQMANSTLAASGVTKQTLAFKFKCSRCNEPRLLHEHHIHRQPTCRWISASGYRCLSTLSLSSKTLQWLSKITLSTRPPLPALTLFQRMYPLPAILQLFNQRVVSGYRRKDAAPINTGSSSSPGPPTQPPAN